MRVLKLTHLADCSITSTPTMAASSRFAGHQMVNTSSPAGRTTSSRFGTSPSPFLLHVAKAITHG